MKCSSLEDKNLFKILEDEGKKRDNPYFEWLQKCLWHKVDDVKKFSDRTCNLPTPPLRKNQFYVGKTGKFGTRVQKEKKSWFSKDWDKFMF